jgi:hypothetical protein
VGTPTVTYDGKSGGISPDVTYVGEKVRLVTGKFTFSNSYATGGEALDLSSMLVDLKGIKFDTNATYRVVYDYTNKKVLSYGAASTAETTAATDLSAVTFRFLAWGTK